MTRCICAHVDICRRLADLGYHSTAYVLAKDSSVDVEGLYSSRELLNIRNLAAAGRWRHLLLYITPLRAAAGDDRWRSVRYAVHRQQLLELALDTPRWGGGVLAVDRDPALAKAAAECLSALRECAPSADAFRELEAVARQGTDILWHVLSGQGAY